MNEIKILCVEITAYECDAHKSCQEVPNIHVINYRKKEVELFLFNVG